MKQPKPIEQVFTIHDDTYRALVPANEDWVWFQQACREPRMEGWILGEEEEIQNLPIFQVTMP